MSTVGVRELRQNLGLYLERVNRGETLSVTEHGRVVALLQPPDASDSLVDRLIAEGRARPARRTPSALPKPLRLRKSLRGVLEEQRAERA